jgi:hypothetical protein
MNAVLPREPLSGPTVQATTKVAASTHWSNLGIAQADYNGQLSFFDPNVSQFPFRFYRVLSPCTCAVTRPARRLGSSLVKAGSVTL